MKDAKIADRFARVVRQSVFGLREYIAVYLLLALSQVAALASLAIISRDVAPDAYGRLVSGLAVQHFVAMAGTLGLKTLVIRDLARNPEHVGTIWGTFWVFIGPAAIVLAAAGHLLSGWFFDHSEAECVMSRWLSAGVVFSIVSVSPLLDGLRRHSLAMLAVALSEAGFLIALLVGLIPLSIVSLGAAFSLKWILASLLCVAAFAFTIKKTDFRFSLDLAKRWSRSAPPLLITTLISQAPFLATVLLVRSLRDADDAAAAGLGVQLAAPLLLIAGTAFRLLQPMLRTDEDLHNVHAKRGVKVAAGGLIAVFAIFVAVAWLLINYWLPPFFEEAWWTVVILLAAALVAGFDYILWAVLNALEVENQILISYGVGTFLFLAISLWLIPTQGHIGAALASLLGTVTTMVLMVQAVLRRHRPQPSPRFPD